jgi:ADP-ribose pyrophosphatase YjhB (NUDIX family)
MSRRFVGRTVTAIVPFPDNTILLVKRATVVFKGYWALPGGKVEPAEPIEQAVVREVKEETGLDVALKKKLGEYLERGVQDGVHFDYQAACFVANPVGGQLRKQAQEIGEIRLFDLEALPKPLAFEHATMIRDYRTACNKQ